MALQSSGQISLNDMHLEVGGTTATQVALNDEDIRGLIGKADGAQASFGDYYGASAASFVGSAVGSGSFDNMVLIPFTLPASAQAGDFVMLHGATADQRGSNSTISGNYSGFTKLLDIRGSSSGLRQNRLHAYFTYTGGSRQFYLYQSGTSVYDGDYATAVALVFRGVTSAVLVEETADTGWSAGAAPALSGTHTSTPTFWAHYGLAWDGGYSNTGSTLTSAPSGLTYANHRRMNASSLSHTVQGNYAVATSATWSVGSFGSSGNASNRSTLFAIS